MRRGRRFGLLVGFLLLVLGGWSLWAEVDDCGGLCIYPSQGAVHVGDIHPIGGIVYVGATAWFAIRYVEPIRLRFNSGGGDFATARLMAAWTRFLTSYHPIRAELSADARCGSSCTIIWAAAPTRIADRNGVFFFHAVRWALISDPAWRFVGLGGQTRLMSAAVAAVDPRLAAYLESRGAYDGQGRDVTLLASDIAALGGPYVTVRR
ncbi:hypothetical protein SAMN07250955_101445 [Arboricoccus pini]|uniref:Uncharacterized protein n=1 Tax=Arboricoccus pini TaxID=1963835 RepID=A0A212Q653_9PROT|nr:hypothetical protein [Arboricoccus pini]SNB54828.1 hypothetical protein SAMN07250955_101445 [Arboricoccus pini]